MEPWYLTREDLMSATDVKTSARNAAQLDGDAFMASRTCDRLLHRKFYPWTGTRYFDWPSRPASRTWRLWLGEFDLTSLDSVTNNDGSVIPLGNVFLNPQDGPPYSSLEINQGTSSAFSSGSTQQRAVALAGTWGWANDQQPAGTLTSGINALVTQPVTVSDSSLVGIGSLLTVGTERMIVTGKAQASTTATLGADLAVSAGATAVTVSNGALVNVGEVILIDAEYLQVVDKAGNVLTVKRAVSGTVIAPHTSGATIYAPRSLTVVRAQTGTTAASHNNGDTVTAWAPPAPVHNLASALAVSYAQQRTDGWTKPGTSKSAQSALNELIEQVKGAYGRFRMETV